MANEKLSAEKLADILSNSRTRGPKTDPTEPREYTTWFRLNHVIKEAGCENPDCEDPREKLTDKGTNIVAHVKGKYMCRYCFLAGWMSNAPTAVI